MQTVTLLWKMGLPLPQSHTHGHWHDPLSLFLTFCSKLRLLKIILSPTSLPEAQKGARRQENQAISAQLLAEEQGRPA